MNTPTADAVLREQFEAWKSAGGMSHNTVENYRRQRLGNDYAQPSLTQQWHAFRAGSALAAQPGALDARTVEACGNCAGRGDVMDWETGRWETCHVCAAPQPKGEAGVDAHIGDPCAKCGIPHDEVAVGLCPGTSASAVDAMWRGLAEFQQDEDHALLQRIGMTCAEYIRAAAPAARGDAEPVAWRFRPRREGSSWHWQNWPERPTDMEQAGWIIEALGPIAAPRPASDDAAKPYWFWKTDTSADDLYQTEHETRDEAIRAALAAMEPDSTAIHLALAKFADPKPGEPEDVGNLDHLYNETLTIAQARQQVGDDARDAGRDVTTLYPAEAWHDDDGDVLWHCPDEHGRICEPPVVGHPLDSAWDAEDMAPYTLWSRLPNVKQPDAAIAEQAGGAK